MSQRRALSAFLLSASLIGCESPSPEVAPEAPAEEAAAAAATDELGVVLIKAEEFAFNAPPTFPSGWVRLRFDNKGNEPHFLLLWDLPDGKTFSDYAAEVSMPFQGYYEKYRSGELDQAAFFEQLTAAIPEWFYEAKPMGGPGFTAPGHVSETIVYLEPGDNYALECYVRSMEKDHRFHGSEGMLRPLVVTDASTELEPPEADIDITLSSFDIAVEGELTPGSHVARVSVEDVPEGLVRHNVHLARLEGEQTTEEAAVWMNWVDSMVPPSPAVFAGGAGQALPGRDSYFMFDLEPGRYAWISEMHGIQGMTQEFTVE